MLCSLALAFICFANSTIQLSIWRQNRSVSVLDCDKLQSICKEST